MPMMLENYMVAHPAVTLSHTEYGHHFHLGRSVNIPTLPAQRLRSFVEDEGTPYRFMVIGRLASFKVAEDSVRGVHPM